MLRRALEAVGVSIHSLPPQAQRARPLSFTAGEDALLREAYSALRRRRL